MTPVSDKPAGYFQHLMCDVETTGTSPDRNHLIQICAIRFNLQRQEYDPEPFNFCLSTVGLAHRSWDESTRDWWMDEERIETLNKIRHEARDPKVVMSALALWLNNTKPLFWANRNGFDFMFIQSYYKDLGLPCPFNWWNTNDLLSYTKGLFIGAKKPFFDKKKFEFIGTRHDAVDDTLHQLRYLFHCENLAREC